MSNYFDAKDLPTAVAENRPRSFHLWTKIYRTVVLFACYLTFGIARTLQGPTLLELQGQLGISDSSAFQSVFAAGAATFPAGNLLAGLAVERLPRLPSSLLLSAATALLAAATAAVPLCRSLATVVLASAAADFALGVLDTGINVYCLQLWGDRSGPYMNALYLFQGVGFLLSPVLSEVFLSSSSPSSLEQNGFNLSSLSFNDSILDFPENFTKEIASLIVFSEQLEGESGGRGGGFFNFSQVQLLYLFVSLLAVVVSAAFLPGAAADRRSRSYDLPGTLPHLAKTVTAAAAGSGATMKREKNVRALPRTTSAAAEKAREAEASAAEQGKSFSIGRKASRVSLVVLGQEDGDPRQALLTALMCLFFLVTNGASFSFGHFLTAFVVRAGIGSQEDGARVTSAYYAAQVASRGANILLSSVPPSLLSRRSILLSHLALLCASSLALAAIPGVVVGGTTLVMCAVALAGLGSGALFPAALLWAQERAEIGARAASLFVLAATCGAQLFRLPEAALIDSHPWSHVYILAAGAAAAVAAFLAASAAAAAAAGTANRNNYKEESNSEATTVKRDGKVEMNFQMTL